MRRQEAKQRGHLLPTDAAVVPVAAQLLGVRQPHQIEDEPVRGGTVDRVDDLGLAGSGDQHVTMPEHGVDIAGEQIADMGELRRI